MAMQAMVWTLGARGGKEHNDIVYMGENWAPSEGEQAILTRSRRELELAGVRPIFPQADSKRHIQSDVMRRMHHHIGSCSSCCNCKGQPPS